MLLFYSIFNAKRFHSICGLKGENSSFLFMHNFFIAQQLIIHSIKITWYFPFQTLNNLLVFLIWRTLLMQRINTLNISLKLINQTIKMNFFGTTVYITKCSVIPLVYSCPKPSVPRMMLIISCLNRSKSCRCVVFWNKILGAHVFTTLRDELLWLNSTKPLVMSLGRLGHPMKACKASCIVTWTSTSWSPYGLT